MVIRKKSGAYHISFILEHIVQVYAAQKGFLRRILGEVGKRAPLGRKSLKISARVDLPLPFALINRTSLQDASIAFKSKPTGIIMKTHGARSSITDAPISFSLPIASKCNRFIL